MFLQGETYLGKQEYYRFGNMHYEWVEAHKFNQQIPRFNLSSLMSLFVSIVLYPTDPVY